MTTQEPTPRQELIKALGVAALIFFLCAVAIACVTLTIIGIIKGYI